MNKYKAIFLRVLLLIGCSIFFYPYISDYINQITQSRAIVKYNKVLSEYDGIEIDKIRDDAILYNEKLNKIKDPLLEFEKIKGYKETLDPFNNGMMGSVLIEKIDVNLPIYHGVNEGVIQKGVGHLPGTSLPIGCTTSHAVITTHSGLPKAKLFTDLIKMEKGDEFIISVLGQNLYYRVDRILKVLPHEVDYLKIEDGKDYVTLMSCTPYGINSHRLLVRGERIKKDYIEDKEANVEKNTEKKHRNSILKIVIISGLFLMIIIDILFHIVNLIRRKSDEYKIEDSEERKENKKW